MTDTRIDFLSLTEAHVKAAALICRATSGDGHRCARTVGHLGPHAARAGDTTVYWSGSDRGESPALHFQPPIT